MPKEPKDKEKRQDKLGELVERLHGDHREINWAGQWAEKPGEARRKGSDR